MIQIVYLACSSYCEFPEISGNYLTLNPKFVLELQEELRRKKAEALKWKDVPEWKKKMLEKKEQQKREQDSAMTQAVRVICP